MRRQHEKQGERKHVAKVETLKYKHVCLIKEGHIGTLTSTNTLQRVEEGHQQVHQHGQVKGDAAPERHVPGAPVQDGLSWKTVVHSPLVV